MPRILFFLIATVVIWLVVCAPLALLAGWLFPSGINTTLPISAIVALPLTTVMWFAIQSASPYLKWPLLQLLGAATVLLTVLAVSAPLHLIFDPQTVGTVALVLWILATVYAIYSARVIKDISLSISSTKLTTACRVVHLSDVHAGSRSSRFLKKAVTQSLTHQPDAVVITGDLLDSSAVDAEFLKPLSAFTCPVWMSLGNHERYVQLENAVAAIAKQNISILRNQAVDFNALHIIGIDDTDNPADAAKYLSARSLPADKFTLLLYHRPDIWHTACEQGVDLTLAGHTHAGQIWPFGLLVKRQFPQMSGYFTSGLSHMFVSQGTGTWGPIMRLGTQCEMTVIDLLPSAS